jgi:hypothetical protein
MLKGKLPFVAVPVLKSKPYFFNVESIEALPKISKLKKPMNVTAVEFNNAVDVSFNNDRYCVSFESPVGQGFDHFIAMLTAEPGESPTSNSPAFVTVIDNKSGMVKQKRYTSNKLKKLNCSQFERFQTLVEALRNLSDSGEITLSRISRALVEGRYQFVYLTTYPNVSPDVKDPRMYMENPNLVICDAEMSKSFYGMTWPLVQSLRSASSESKIRKYH